MGHVNRWVLTYWRSNVAKVPSSLHCCTDAAQFSIKSVCVFMSIYVCIESGRRDVNLTRNSNWTKAKTLEEEKERTEEEEVEEL